jgi:GTP-binding protein
MKFIDESEILVAGGNGGDGCVSFRRQRNLPKGGPDGGDGGDGGCIYIRASRHLNSLLSFSFKKKFHAEDGASGKSCDCKGNQGKSIIIDVPLGTKVTDKVTGEVLARFIKHDQLQMVAKGGWHGLGNSRFKSSTNRSPRLKTSAQVGERRNLLLELLLLADVGLLGLPNAGKSTLIRSVSAAKPKVADYPFTTLIPNLGVVSVDSDRSFVIADVPGLIAGASNGVGLGTQFLKHLEHCRILLHIIDLDPIDGSDPINNTRITIEEVKKYSEKLFRKPRWLVFNKVDLFSSLEEAETKAKNITKNIGWHQDYYLISTLGKFGLKKICRDAMSFLSDDRD